MSLKGLAEVIDNAVEIDFGTNGLGGSPDTTTADGYYALSFSPTGSQPGVAATHHFYRLLGDVEGNGMVDQNDVNANAAARGLSSIQIASAIGQSATGLTPLSQDANGDGLVNSIDQLLASLYKGRKLALPPGDPSVESRVRNRLRPLRGRVGERTEPCLLSIDRIASQQR